tara:strand:+ start:143 stop:610 length:468 start_codon:yes stop_codon:yes gene_type:complete
MEKGVRIKEGLRGDGLRVGVVCARWNARCTNSLKDQVIAGLIERGVMRSNVVEYEVAGSFELVHASSVLIEKEGVDVVIPIGVLIKGDTLHFEYIAEAVTHGLMRLQQEKNIPIIFAILTCLTEDQAVERSVGPKSHGDAWAATAIEMGLLAKDD